MSNEPLKNPSQGPAIQAPDKSAPGDGSKTQVKPQDNVPVKNPEQHPNAAKDSVKK